MFTQLIKRLNVDSNTPKLANNLQIRTRHNYLTLTKIQVNPLFRTLKGNERQLV